MTDTAREVLDDGVPGQSSAGRRQRDLRPLFQPRSIAVIGASDRNPHASSLLATLTSSFAGGIYPINPGRTEVAGLPCYPSVGALPEVPELAVVLVGRASVYGALLECADVGVKAAIINADGYAESTDPDGKRLQADLATLAHDSGMMLLGPNGLGLEDLTHSTLVFCAPISEPVKPGRLAVISQSGGNCVAFAEAAIDRGIGLSRLVSSGNEADLAITDFIDYLVDAPDVGAFCLYIEAIRDPEAFLRATERARVAGKPVVAIKVGRSEVGRAAALAHTGAITGSDAAVDALFERAGVVRAGTIDEALDLASVVAQLPSELWPRGRRTLVFTMGGGAASIIADAAAQTRLEITPLPTAMVPLLSAGIPEGITVKNPIDVIPEGITVKNPIDVPGVHFGKIPDVVIDYLRIGLQGDDFDGAVAALPLPSSLRFIRGLSDLQREFAKPIVVTTPSRTRVDDPTRAFMAETGVAVVAGLGEALSGLDLAIGFVEAENRPIGEISASPAGLAALRAEVAASAESGATALEPGLAERLLAAYGIGFPRSAVAASATEAVAAAREFGRAVAIKAAASDVHHKTELGGVRLGLQDADDIAAAYDEVTTVTAGHPGGDKVLVQEMVGDGLELILGVSNSDEGYPPTIVVGLGGVLVELLRDTSTRLAPVSIAEAEEMLASLRGHGLLQGFRGQPARDVAAAAAAVSAMSRFAVDFADLIGAVDVNPLIVGEAGAGAKAVDALVVLAVK